MIRITDKTNGEAVLQPISCLLSMTINGVWIIKMEHPYDREGRWQNIAEDNILKIDIDALDGVSSEQQYRIHLVQRSLTSIYVEAYPIALDYFNYGIIDDIVYDNISASDLASALRNRTYNVTTNIDKSARVNYQNTNLIALLNGDEESFVAKFGGEIRYNNMSIAINNRLDSGATAYIYAGRDVSSLMHSINTSDVVTRLYPLSATGERLYDEGNWGSNKPYVDSEYIDDYDVPHAEFIKTPYVLMTEDEKNADREAYEQTYVIKSTIIDATTEMIDNMISQRDMGNYKFNLDYIQSILKLTAEKDKYSGIIEAIQREATSLIPNATIKQMINNWIAEGLGTADDYEEEEFVIWYYNNHFVYGVEGLADTRVKSEWVRIDNKWRWFDSNGYLDSSKDDESNWSWFTREGNKYFGHKGSSASADKKAISQWLKIDGQWYWFTDLGIRQQPSMTASIFINELIARLNIDYYAGQLNEIERQLYEGLYNRMIAYCNYMFSQGIDQPKFEINLEAMDISQIEGYQSLRTLRLGNNVVFRNNGTTINERVVELEYDCIRNINTRVVLGMPTETITAIITRNIAEGQKLIAGYGVNIDGNVINIASGGGKAQAGLRWWEETSNHIERSVALVPTGGWTCDDEYLVQSQVEWHDYYDEGALEYTKNFRKKTAGKAIGALMRFYSGGYSTTVYAPILLSPVKDDVSIMFGGRNESPNTEMYGYVNAITYEGMEWYVSGGNTYNTATLDPSATLYEPASDIKWRDNSYNTYSGELPVISTLYDNFYEAIMALLQMANIKTRFSHITGMSVGQNYPFYGGYIESGSVSAENAPFRVKDDGTIYGKDVECGNDILSNKQDKLTAGQNVQIQNNTISATDTTYTAGQNVQISNTNVISATDTTYSDFAGSTHGLVPPVSIQSGKFLKDNGTWAEVQGGGSDVTITPTLQSGTKIADYEIDGVSGELFAPSGGGSSDLDAIKINKNDYDALSPAEKMDEDKIYFVPDYSVGGDINVADELDISNMSLSVNSTEIPSQSAVHFTFSNVPMNPVNGKPLGVVGYALSDNRLIMTKHYVTFNFSTSGYSANLGIDIFNLADTSITISSVGVDILYAIDSDVEIN